MNAIPIRIISLASRLDRRRRIAAQFDRLGISGYSFLDAVNGREQPDPSLFTHYDPLMPWLDEIRREAYKACDEFSRICHNLRFRLRFRRPAS